MMTTEMTPEEVIEESLAKQHKFSIIMMSTSASALVLMGIAAFLIGPASLPSWLVPVLLTACLVPLIMSIHRNWSFRAALHLQRSAAATHVPMRKSLSLGSSVAPKFTESEVQGNMRLLTVLGVTAVVLLIGGDALVKWMVSTDAPQRLFEGLTLLFSACMGALALYGFVRMMRSNSKARKLNRDVSNSLQLYGYEWVDAAGVLPGNVYTAERPALFKDYDGNYSRWVIEWEGEFAKATWLDPALSEA